MPWNFAMAGNVAFGWDAIDSLQAVLNLRGWSRALVITDATLIDCGIVDRLKSAAGNAQLEVFSEGEAEPSIQIVREAAQRVREVQPDVVIGLGGGSNLDLAKFTATLGKFPGEPEDFFGYNNVPGPVVPMIGIPTTSGTGSEVSHAAVLTDTENEMKVSMLSHFLRPEFAICDPSLSVTCPRSVTAHSGIDALTHAVEAYIARRTTELNYAPIEMRPYEGAHPLGDLLAAEAIRLVGRHLVTACDEPENKSAREGMALASLYAGLAFSNCGVAMVHALEYPVGGAVHVSHGEGNGLLLPFVMRFNMPARLAEFANIATWLGEDIKGLSEDQAAERAICAVFRLRKAIGIRDTLSELGVTEEMLPGFAEKAHAIKRLRDYNPREPSVEDVLAMYRDAL